jgi:hypothetical protein
MVPDLIAEKINARKANEPIYIRLVTLGGEYDPFSLGATLMESIESELKNNYPDLALDRDVILKIQDVQIDPGVNDEIKKIKEFTVKQTMYEDRPVPEEVKQHIKALNKNRNRLSGIIKFRYGSIGDMRPGGLMADVLKDNPDLVVCNLVFYHLDVWHQKNFIDFIGRTASEKTTFMFAFNTELLTYGADRYVDEFNGDKDLTLQVRPTYAKDYPPLFEKYFKLRSVQIGRLNSNFYLMRKKPAQDAADFAITIDKVSLQDIQFIGKRRESNVAFGQEVLYQGKRYFAKWGRAPGYSERHGISEARILKYLEGKDVKGIPKVSHILENNGMIYVLFDVFEEGSDLMTLNKLYGVSQQEAVDIVLKVSKIVKSLMDNGVYHWDIKPDNIWITNNGEVVLFDFNFSFSVKEAQGTKRMNFWRVWTRPYASPNRILQARSPENSIDFSPCDEIYSIGVTLARLLGMKLDAGDKKLIDSAIEAFVPEPIIDLYILKLDDLEEVPGYIRLVIENALNSKYGTVDDFIKSLEKAKNKAFQPKMQGVLDGGKMLQEAL